MAFDLLLLLALVLLNGVFAGAEIAVLSMRKTRLAELVEAKKRGAKAVYWLRSQPERFLATVQIAITLVSTTAAAFGGDTLAEDLARTLRTLPVIGGVASTLGLLVVIAGVSFFSIVLGELVPKSLALRSSERYSLAVAGLLRMMSMLLKPAVWLLTFVSNVILRLFGDRTSFTESRFSPEEMQELLEEAAKVGALDKKTSQIASRALEFRELRAMDIMAPRTTIVCVSKDATVEELKALLVKNFHTRLPVYEGARENIVGYIAVSDVLVGPYQLTDRPIGSVLRTIKFVPETVSAVDLLKQLQSDRGPIALVGDETGDIVGIVTVEDLIEEIVGEIVSERDPVTTEPKFDESGRITVTGTTPIREVNRLLDTSLPEQEVYTTIAGLCLALAAKIPETGTILHAPDGTIIEVIDASSRRVRTVRVQPPPKKNDLPTEG